jgi:hypothetical protein
MLMRASVTHTQLMIQAEIVDLLIVVPLILSNQFDSLLGAIRLMLGTGFD